MVEMIASLAFFSISGAVILQVFAAAHRRSAENSARESAILCAQSVAEAYSVSGNAEEACKRVFGIAPQSESSGYVVLLDESCTPEASSPQITLTMSENRSITAAGVLSELTLCFTSESGELFGMSCSAYKPIGGAADD
ncbi:MAG: hypothetical protein ACI4KM_12845 [Oscillospiraceae bacterium]